MLAFGPLSMRLFPCKKTNFVPEEINHGTSTPVFATLARGLA